MDSNARISQLENEDCKPMATRLCGFGRAVDGVSNGMSDEQYLASFPVGWRFAPTELQLFYYLQRKVNKQPLPPNKIKSVNLYELGPVELLAKYNISVAENEWYFFTPRERKYRQGKRPSRSAGKGYWKATGVDKHIFDDKDKRVGSKKTLVYYRGKAPKGTKTNFIMHEFVLHDASETIETDTTHHMRLNEWVLCRIHKKLDKTSLQKNDNNSKSNKVDSPKEMDDKNQVAPIEPSGSDLINALEPTTDQANGEEVMGLPSSPNVDHVSTLPGYNLLDDHPCLFPSLDYYPPQFNSMFSDPPVFVCNQDFQQDEVKLDMLFPESYLCSQSVPLDFFDFDEQKNDDFSLLDVKCIPNAGTS